MQFEPEDSGRLRDMIDFGQEAIDLLGVMTVEQMAADRRTFLAVSRCVEIVGEAGWKLSDNLKNAYTTIPWPLIAGMRHRLVHDYGRVDSGVVFKVITQHLPPLIVQIKAILAQGGTTTP
jgi:uncharacterized protein with HEPN domain